MNRIGYKITKPKRRRIHPAAGIRRKIRYGFIILGCLLLFAGMVSYFELSRLSRITTELMENSLRDLNISGRMLDAIEQQNATLNIRIHTPQDDSLNTDSLFLAGKLGFDTAYAEAKNLNIYKNRMERIGTAKIAYDKALQEPVQNPQTDSLVWYDHQYRIAYFNLVLKIKDLMIDSQNTIDQNAAKIQNNTYRAIMPGIITLAIAILIIFVFYILIDMYYIRPVLKVEQGLDNYLKLKVPYNIQVEGRDEVKDLSDGISTLITLIRKKENNAEG